MPYPGIPEDALARVEEPNPLDLGPLRSAIETVAKPPDGPLGACLDYGRLLLAANTAMNLTGARDWTTLLEAHLVDCATAAGFVPEDARSVVDWGSGAGLPGIVWAILLPEKRVLLAERTGKKAGFLEEVVVRLGLSNAGVLRGQAEERLRDEERVDLVVARAVEPLPRLLGRIRRNRVRHRSLFAMVGPSWEEEWESMGDDARRSWALSARHRYALPGDRGERHLVVFKPR